MAYFLVIDDDNTIRQMMMAALEHAGHHVVEAATGEEGAAMFRACPTDVVITDILMPHDGIQSVIELRQQFPAVPIIVVSGLSAQSAHSQEVTGLLAPRRTLPKPFRLHDFLGVIDAVLSELNIPLPAAKKQ